MKPRRLLIVDDNPVDRALAARAFADTGLPLALSFAEGAAAALRLLEAAQGLPHMLLVDVEMPGRNGLALLDALKTDARWRDIPVCLVSGSDDPAYVRAAYRGHASGYFRKPGDAAGLRRLAETLGRLCLEAYLCADLE